MERLRVYVDTSVIGGALDDEWADDTQALIELFQRRHLTPVISDVVRLEVQQSPPGVRSVLSDLDAYAESVSSGDEADELASAYIDAAVVTSKYRLDALHIATATLAKVDVLVSWNFKHIVNLRRIKGFNGVNLIHGYRTIEIRSPREVLSDDENEKE